LVEFLGALGAKNIEWKESKDSFVSGIANFSMNNSEDQQEFIWEIDEKDVPGENVFNLAKFIKERELLSIDMITITRGELYRIFTAEFGVTKEYFLEALESLENIEVSMIDDGEKTDSFFIHE